MIGLASVFALLMLAFSLFVRPGRKAAKSCISFFIGFLLACVSQDVVTGEMRMAFGSTIVASGNPFEVSDNAEGIFLDLENTAEEFDECRISPKPPSQTFNLAASLLSCKDAAKKARVETGPSSGIRIIPWKDLKGTAGFS